VDEQVGERVVDDDEVVPFPLGRDLHGLAVLARGFLVILLHFPEELQAGLVVLRVLLLEHHDQLAVLQEGDLLRLVLDLVGLRIERALGEGVEGRDEAFRVVRLHEHELPQVFLPQALDQPPGTADVDRRFRFHPLILETLGALDDL
jgi:hypothetical protein